jgi:hypothetical protein
VTAARNRCPSRPVQIAPELRLEAAAARNGEEKVLGRNVQITISLMGYLWGIMRIGIKAIVKWCFGGIGVSL